MASRDSLSMLVTLELRERVNELSLASGAQTNIKESRNDLSEMKKSGVRRGRLYANRRLADVNGIKSNMLKQILKVRCASIFLVKKEEQVF